MFSPGKPRGSGPHLHFCAGKCRRISSATSSPNPPPPFQIPRNQEKSRVDVLSLILFSCVCVCACMLSGGRRLQGNLLNPEN